MAAHVLDAKAQVNSDPSNSLEQRIALLKRFRSMLELQREKFRDYLKVLEKQEVSIKEGNSNAIEQQCALEQAIIKEIFALQKVIAPLDTMYQEFIPNHDGQVEELRASLNSIKDKVLVKNQRNIELLKSSRDILKKKILELKIPQNRKSIYASENKTSTMVDLQA
jgi:hypothetical protein